MDHIYLSVDLGGTSLRVGVLNGSGEILKLETINSDEVREPHQLTKRLTNEFLKLEKVWQAEGCSIEGAGLGIPGLVDHDQGIIFQSPHFPKWRDFALQAALDESIPFPIYLENDANKAALGEAWFGAGKKLSDFIMLTLGTGVGGGIILDGKIFHGSCGFAGEVGHIVIDKDGLPGALGIQGTLETFASLSGLRIQLGVIQSGSHGIPRTDPIFKIDKNAPDMPEALERLAQAGNEYAQDLWQKFGEALACGVASLANAFGIFNFVIGGGVAGAWEMFYPHLKEEIPKRMYRTTAAKIQMLHAELGNQAGLIGGIPMVQQRLKGI